MAVVGRISPKKRVERAIEIAKRAGMPLKIAAKVDVADEKYYQEKIKPLLNHPLIEYIGEVTEDEKDDLLGNAYALLFPIDWPEPFGLVMIESLACGTPVIAYEQGAVPEVLDNGKTGFIVNSIEESVQAVQHIESISRKGCRQAFEARFSATRMAQNYADLYQHLREESWMTNAAAKSYLPQRKNPKKK